MGSRGTNHVLGKLTELLYSSYRIETFCVISQVQYFASLVLHYPNCWDHSSATAMPRRPPSAVLLPTTAWACLDLLHLSHAGDKATRAARRTFDPTTARILTWRKGITARERTLDLTAGSRSEDVDDGEATGSSEDAGSQSDTRYFAYDISPPVIQVLWCIMACILWPPVLLLQNGWPADRGILKIQVEEAQSQS